MTDKIVTLDDLGDLLDLRSHCADFDSDEAERKVEMLDRLIAAAEADAPPLPEGWVLAHMAGESFPYWYQDGALFQGVTDSGTPVTWRDSVGSHNRAWLSPLRPTITEADVDQAARVEAIRQEKDDEAWALAVEAERNEYRLDVRAAFAAAGVVIEP